MKIAYAFLLLNVLSASAQTNDKPVKLVHYALDSFTNAKVQLKSGKVYSELMNYNLVTKEMIFEQNGKYLAIAHPEEVDTIYLDRQKFIPVGNGFYEWLTGSTYPLFKEYTCTVKEPGANTGFGTTSTTAAATAVKALLKDGGAYALKLPDDYQVVAGHSFYVRKNGRYHKVSNEQQIIKLFPEKKQILKDWIKNHNNSFSKEADLILLIQQIQEPKSNIEA